MQTARIDQMKEILTYHPTLIMGDFNAQTSYEDTHLQSNYWRQKGVQTAEDLPLVRKYLTELHPFLNQQGWTSCFDETQMRPTTAHTISDWIYLNKTALDATGYHVEVIEQGRVKALAQDLSDHDFLWVRLRFIRKSS